MTLAERIADALWPEIEQHVPGPLRHLLAPLKPSLAGAIQRVLSEAVAPKVDAILSGNEQV